MKAVRSVSAGLVLLIALQGFPLGAPGAAAAGPPPDGFAAAPGMALAPAWSDLAPERWVAGRETIESMDLAVGERVRVLPGARLDVANSTLRFAAVSGGLTGIVAEPGSEVHVFNTLLTGQAGSGAFLVHLEGNTTLVQSRIAGAAAVVLQPRSLTDHVDQSPLGKELEGAVPGWRAARTLTNASAHLRASVVQGPAGLVVGVPEQYQANVPASLPAVRIASSTIQAVAGPALSCYATRSIPDPDRGLAVPVVAEEPFTRLALVDTVLESGTGPALHCAPAPAARALPARNLPLAPPALASPANEKLPPPPRPQVFPGPEVVTMAGGALRGAGVGALLDAVTRLESTATRFEGLALAVRVAAPGASARVAGAVGSGLGAGFEVLAGAGDFLDGSLAGAGSGAGLRMAGGAATFTNLVVAGFATGVDAGAAATFRSLDLRGMGTCARLAAAATLRDSALRNCGTGVLLDRATGATVTANTVTDSADPLRVATDAPPVRAHFSHTVTANTVNGRSLSYIVDSTADRTEAGAIGHVVLAFSSNVRYSDLELSRGKLHVTASTNVVLGATTANTRALLSGAAPQALAAFAKVQDQVRYKPYPGSMLGPAGALGANYSNDLDASWTLVDLWRKQGLTARFVDGTHLGPTDAFLNWVNMRHPGYAFGMAGVNAQWFGATYRMPRVWTEVQAAPGVWVEADPSYKQYTWTTPLDLKGMSGIDSDALILAGAQGATLMNGVRGASKINTQAIYDTMLSYSQDGMAGVNATGRPLDGGDIAFVGTARAVLPSEDVSRSPTSRFQDVPASRMWSARITTVASNVPASAMFDTMAYLHSLYGKRISINSFPDNPAENAKALAAGSIYNVDPRKINFTTLLYIDGNVVDAIGGVKTTKPDGSVAWSLPAESWKRPVVYHPGDQIDMRVEIRQPGGAVYATHRSPFRVGGTYSIVLDIGGSPSSLVDQRIERLRSTLDAWGYGTSTSAVSQDELLGELYYLQGLWYFNKLHQFGTQAGAQMLVQEVPIASVAMTGTSAVAVQYSDGTQKLTVTPPYFDILNLNYAYTMDGNRDKLRDFHISEGVIGSALEDKVFTELYALPAVSTIKILTEANRANVPIYHINASEAEALPQLSLPSVVKDSIVAAVNDGKSVIVPKSQITYLNWTGVGWIELDMDTGGAGWLIYGGTSPILGDVTGTVLAEPIIMRGGSGAQYGPSGNRLLPDFGYEGWPQTGVEWTTTHVGTLSDIVGTSLNYKDILYPSASDGRRFWEGVALNNDQKSLLGKFDVPTKYGKYFEKAGNVLTVIDHTNDMYNILQNGHPPETKVAQMVGVTAINVGTVLASEAAIGGFAKLGAVVGGAVGDGPGIVIGAVVGAVAGAVALGVASGWLKEKFLGLF